MSERDYAAAVECVKTNETDVAGFEPDRDSLRSSRRVRTPVTVFGLASLSQKTDVAGVTRATAGSEGDYAAAVE
ncbi:hypothetical protein [Haloplanus sp. C73]|uniref:hypothetical protein n=1 Tax=Haloplanus sp. C73 TaxID=3421641 RepID=UPI003EB8EF5D